MSRRAISLSLSLFLLLSLPGQAFLSGFGSDKEKDKDSTPGIWDSIVTSAKDTLKKSEKDEGNKDTPTWGELTDRAGKAMKQFAKDGKGFDIMQKSTKKVKRRYEKLTADEDSALIGHFYDLKQPIDAKARPLRRHEVVHFIKKYMESGWDSRLLKQYYSPDVELAAPYFYLPRCKASYAPEAFECNRGEQKKQVAPQDWLVVYTGEVTAPESGTYRFVGMGDDTIVVRFNKTVVLESGWSIPSRNNMTLGTNRNYQQEITSPASGRVLYQYKETPHWNRNLGGIASGRTFSVEAGKRYPIQILISEIPGNEFGYCLLIEKMGDKTPTCGIIAPGQAPTLNLFRTNDTTPDLEEIAEGLRRDDQDYSVGRTLEAPPFAEDSPIWIARSGKDTTKRSIMERVTADAAEDTAMGRRKARPQKKLPRKPEKP
jgi:hypothetical protein